MSWGTWFSERLGSQRHLSFQWWAKVSSDKKKKADENRNMCEILSQERLTYMLPPRKAAHSGFETKRCHQKFKTEISVVPQ